MVGLANYCLFDNLTILPTQPFNNPTIQQFKK